ncbi:EspG family protein [Amycolatopsis xylanica]|uniref:EspG family protein n=1 Tax=Amycolatopsis xylanica TaxID=589385 RepID=A0A1H2SET0_9PSEU|nr:ESX secretion-associated protein EspG [Amycolatopsis xylanica]SDW30146.1 EspG family protein [Amycolatopsis xylanica]
MTLIDAAVVLPKLAFITAWNLEDLGEPHPVLGTNQHYFMTEDFRRTVRNRTLDLLGERRLARRGAISPLLVDTLTTIADADREFYGWSTVSGRPGDAGAALVAARDHDAIRAVVTDQVVLLEPVPGRGLAARFVETLPPVPGAVTRSVVVSRAQPDGAGRSAFAEPADTRDLDHLHAVMTAPRDAVHQLYTAIRTGTGTRRRSLPITALDVTGEGRIVTYLNDDPDTGAECVNLRSGSPAALTRLLETTNQTL